MTNSAARLAAWLILSTSLSSPSSDCTGIDARESQMVPADPTTDWNVEEETLPTSESNERDLFETDTVPEPILVRSSVSTESRIVPTGLFDGQNWEEAVKA